MIRVVCQQVPVPQAIPAAFNSKTKTLFAFPQGFLGTSQVGNIVNNGLETVIFHFAGIHQYLNFCTIFNYYFPFSGHGKTFIHMIIPEGFFIKMLTREEYIYVFPYKLIMCIPGNTCHGNISIGYEPLVITDQYTICRVVEYRSEPLFTLLHLLFNLLFFSDIPGY